MWLADYLVVPLYCSLVGCFPLMANPVGSCLILVASMIVSLCYVYLVCGYSWYMLVFGAVYLGGIYILLIFVSLAQPNSTTVGNVQFLVLVLFWASLSGLFELIDVDFGLGVNSGEVVCSYAEGVIYYVFSVVLVMGFWVVSAVSSEKCCFYR